MGIAFVGFEYFFSSLFLFKSLFALVLGFNKKLQSMKLPGWKYLD